MPPPGHETSHMYVRMHPTSPDRIPHTHKFNYTAGLGRYGGSPILRTTAQAPDESGMHSACGSGGLKGFRTRLPKAHAEGRSSIDKRPWAI